MEPSPRTVGSGLKVIGGVCTPCAGIRMLFLAEGTFASGDSCAPAKKQVGPEGLLIGSY